MNEQIVGEGLSEIVWFLLHPTMVARKKTMSLQTISSMRVLLLAAASRSGEALRQEESQEGGGVAVVNLRTQAAY